MSTENFLYATGYRRRLFQVVGSKVAALVGADGELAAVVLPRIDAGYLSEDGIDCSLIVFYGDFVWNRADQLNQAAQRTWRTIEDSVSSATFDDGVTEALSLLGWSAADVLWEHDTPARGGRLGALDVWRAARQVKTAGEIALLRRSAQIAESICAATFEACLPGTPWSSIARRMAVLAAENDATMGFSSSGAGTLSGCIYESPERVLSVGDLVRLDLGVVYRHYWSDTGRTGVVGAASPVQASRYQALRTGMEHGVEILRPGVALSEVFASIVDTVRQSGIESYARSHCGHTIGLTMYDGSLVAPDDETVCEVGMVLNLEVPYYELGWGGLQIEDTVVITENGVEFLTHAPRTLGELG